MITAWEYLCLESTAKGFCDVWNIFVEYFVTVTLAFEILDIKCHHVIVFIPLNICVKIHAPLLTPIHRVGDLKKFPCDVADIAFTRMVRTDVWMYTLWLQLLQRHCRLVC